MYFIFSFFLSPFSTYFLLITSTIRRQLEHLCSSIRFFSRFFSSSLFTKPASNAQILIGILIALFYKYSFNGLALSVKSFTLTVSHLQIKSAHTHSPTHTHVRPRVYFSLYYLYKHCVFHDHSYCYYCFYHYYYYLC